MMPGSALIYSVALLAAGIFAGAAWHKARGFAAFAGIVRAYEIAPAAMALVLAAGLLATEIAAVFLLLATPWAGAAGLVVAGALFIVYACAMLYNFARGKREIDCGCSWGGSEARAEGITVWHVLRSAALGCLTLSSGAIWAANTPVTFGAGEMAVAGAVAAVALITYATCETLIGNSVSFGGAG